MKIIVSTELEDIYSNFTVVKDCKEIENLNPNEIEVLIIHKPNLDNFNFGMFLQNWYASGITNFIYINSEPSTVIKMLVDGVGGTYIEDEFYFDDEEELVYLLDEMKDGFDSTETTALATTNIDVLKGFFKSFACGDERIRSAAYMEQAVQAVTDLALITENQSTQITTMGKSALDVFQKANNIITNMDKQRQTIQKQLQALETTSRQNTKPQLGGGINYFPTYQYRDMATVVVIRELTPCRYLGSFIHAYEYYLHYTLEKKCKLIYIHQKGKNFMKRYDKFVSITQESANTMSLYENEVVATNNPKTNVLKTLFSQKVDIFIVVDRLYGDSPIVTGRVKAINAVGGKSDIERFGIKRENTIFSSLEVEGGLLYIPSIKRYPDKDMPRFTAYNQLCKERFEALDDYIGIIKD